MARGTVLVGALAALAVAALAAPASAKLKADYRFEGNFNSKVGSAPNLVPEGVNELCPQSCFKFGVAVRNTSQGAWDWAEGAGLRLDDARKAVGSPATYSIVMLVRLDDVEGYNKLIDFDDRGSDQGLYIDDGLLDIYSLRESDDKVIKDDRWRQIVLTRDGKGKVKGYVDGDRVAGANDPDRDQVMGGDEVLHFLIDDTIQDSEQSGGFIARLRIYDDALSGKAVGKLGI